MAKQFNVKLPNLLYTFMHVFKEHKKVFNVKNIEWGLTINYNQREAILLQS